MSALHRTQSYTLHWLPVLQPDCGANVEETLFFTFPKPKTFLYSTNGIFIASFKHSLSETAIGRRHNRKHMVTGVSRPSRTLTLAEKNSAFSFHCPQAQLGPGRRFRGPFQNAR